MMKPSYSQVSKQLVMLGIFYERYVLIDIASSLQSIHNSVRIIGHVHKNASKFIYNYEAVANGLRHIFFSSAKAALTSIPMIPIYQLLNSILSLGCCLRYHVHCSSNFNYPAVIIYNKVAC